MVRHLNPMNYINSWGKGISFHDDGNDRSTLDSFDTESNNDTKVSSRLESKVILAIATSGNHSVCNTLHTRYCSRQMQINTNLISMSTKIFSKFEAEQFAVRSHTNGYTYSWPSTFYLLSLTLDDTRRCTNIHQRHPRLSQGWQSRSYMVVHSTSTDQRYNLDEGLQ